MDENDDLPLVADYFASGAAAEDREAIGEFPEDLEFLYEMFLAGWNMSDEELAKLELLADAECELRAERELK